MASKKIESDIKSAKLGNTVIRTIPGKHTLDDVQEVTYSSNTFNPFDQLNIRTQERKMKKVYIEKDNINQNYDDQNLTLSSETDNTSGQSSDGEQQTVRNQE